MTRYLARCVVGALLLAPLVAWGDGAGVLIQRNGDRLVLGYDTGSGGEGSQGLGARAFGGVVGPEYLSQVPSFLSLATPPTGSEDLPISQSVEWDFLPLTVDGATSNLMYWDGVSPFELTPAESASLTLYDPSFAAATAHGDASAEPGLRLGTTTAGNLYRLHAHRLWYLEGEANQSPADGVYVAALRVRMEDLVPTEPFFVALGTPGLASAVNDQATPWLDQNADALVLPGDYNFDGLVDDADLAVWSSQYGESYAQPVSSGDADGNLDGVIDGADYTIWRDTGAAAPGAVAVPEPAALIALGCLLAARASRRPDQTGR